jgi:plasmid maintenance system antidote protein VapI
LRIGKLVGGGPEVWLAMQQSYDLETIEAEIAKELRAIPTLHAAE